MIETDKYREAKLDNFIHEKKMSKEYLEDSSKTGEEINLTIWYLNYCMEKYNILL